jgi:hypothetical protein
VVFRVEAVVMCETVMDPRASMSMTSGKSNVPNCYPAHGSGGKSTMTLKVSLWPEGSSCLLFTLGIDLCHFNLRDSAGLYAFVPTARMQHADTNKPTLDWNNLATSGVVSCSK